MRVAKVVSFRGFAVIGALLALSACGGGGGTDTSGTTGNTGEPPAANRMPVAADVFGLNAQLNTALTGALPVATDPDGDALTYVLDAAPGLGVVQMNADGRFTYTPHRIGFDSFR